MFLVNWEINMLISKDENIELSPVLVSSKILKLFGRKKAKRLLIYDVASELKKDGVNGYRPLLFSLTFLYSTGIIEFKEPYIKLKQNG